MVKFMPWPQNQSGYGGKAKKSLCFHRNWSPFFELSRWWFGHLLKYDSSVKLTCKMKNELKRYPACFIKVHGQQRLTPHVRNLLNWVSGQHNTLLNRRLWGQGDECWVRALVGSLLWGYGTGPGQAWHGAADQCHYWRVVAPVQYGLDPYLFYSILF
jgi:hypothetical protein